MTFFSWFYWEMIKRRCYRHHDVKLVVYTDYVEELKREHSYYACWKCQGKSEIAAEVEDREVRGRVSLAF